MRVVTLDTCHRHVTAAYRKYPWKKPLEAALISALAAVETTVGHSQGYWPLTQRIPRSRFHPVACFTCSRTSSQPAPNTLSEFVAWRSASLTSSGFLHGRLLGHTASTLPTGIAKSGSIRSHKVCMTTVKLCKAFQARPFPCLQSRVKPGACGNASGTRHMAEMQVKHVFSWPKGLTRTQSPVKKTSCDSASASCEKQGNQEMPSANKRVAFTINSPATGNEVSQTLSQANRGKRQVGANKSNRIWHQVPKMINSVNLGLSNLAEYWRGACAQSEGFPVKWKAPHVLTRAIY